MRYGDLSGHVRILVLGLRVCGLNSFCWRLKEWFDGCAGSWVYVWMARAIPLLSTGVA